MEKTLVYWTLMLPSDVEAERRISVPKSERKSISQSSDRYREVGFSSATLD
jgi:hypothetical protein